MNPNPYHCFCALLYFCVSLTDLNVSCPVRGVEPPVTGSVLLLAVRVADKLLGRQIGLALRAL